MTTTKRRGIFPLHALAAATALGCATQASAVSFNIGEIEGQFDSSLSVGASWSMRSADKDYIGTRNGGHASSQTSDDGRLNFKKGETFSKIFKGIHDLELKYGDTGAFFRGKYWYDFELRRTNTACSTTSTTTIARRAPSPPGRSCSMPSSTTTTVSATCPAACGSASRW